MKGISAQSGTLAGGSPPAKFSQGPWRSGEPNDDSYFQDVNIIRPDGLAVGVAVNNGDIDAEETIANGHLMAAAPAMFTRLTAIVAAHDAWREALPPDWEGDPISDEVEAAKADLAKAQGEPAWPAFAASSTPRAPRGAFHADPSRASEPFFLYGFPDNGAVAITNAEIVGDAVRLHRFRTAEQGERAALEIIQNAGLSLDGETYHVPEAENARTPDQALLNLIIWARRVDPLITRRLAALGPGHYSLADQARRQAA